MRSKNTRNPIMCLNKKGFTIKLYTIYKDGAEP